MRGHLQADEDGRLARKADMFTKRTIKPHEDVTTVDTASEALAVSISEKACVDMAYMEQLTGKTGEELADELRGVIFRVPGQTEPDGTPHYAVSYTHLAEKVAVQLTGSWQEWAGFLTTAARPYKYPYHEQLMIYAQRPDATACAEYDLLSLIHI